MSRPLVLRLLLVILALSSSNVLPIASIWALEINSYDGEGQMKDNIFSNKHLSGTNLKQLCNIDSFKLFNSDVLWKLCDVFKSVNDDSDNNHIIESSNDINEDKFIYNGDGFRKEQWHNYPRQLDRLHRLQYNIDKYFKFDPGDAKMNFQNYESDLSKHLTKEHILNGNGEYNVYDAVVMDTNPLMILKIQLMSSNNNEYDGKTNDDHNNDLKMESDGNRNDNEETNNTPMLKQIDHPNTKVLRDSQEDCNECTVDASRKTVTKRLFSLWSRLQGLTHKGHELQHRRHMYAYYGLPESDGSPGLTAEPRAGVNRPPGAPLRWG